MKYLKRIDFVGQSFIWLMLTGGSVLILFSGKGIGGIGYIGLMCQLFMGCWQMVSSALFMILKADYFKSRSTHFLLAVICLAAIGLTTFLNQAFNNTITGSLLVIAGIVMPWCLAIFYYSITWNWMFPKRVGKFLPHINF